VADGTNQIIMAGNLQAIDSMKKTTVPLELINLHDDGFHLLVEVVVFGQKFNAVLDTGASKTVLDKTIVEKYITAEELLYQKNSQQVSAPVLWKAILSFSRILKLAN
jgi:predicted aspartyl protease